ncbi:hypothetical protein PFAG_05034 [Plasmodium falciparum Santa Lucia]|uniref:Uncharacterized protein n=1 Tax=Plasmodium falciparum Santa Lucia TaxID=478859 RepID=W7FZW8_PLAFA|nr:hypothetical protein PFAG_05034 [Plasmodium falciparum Santa Lucia]
MRKYLCKVSFNVIILIILFCHIIIARNNKTIKWIDVEKDGKIFNHIVRYFIKDDKILKIYTINNNIIMENIDDDYYMNNKESLLKNNDKNDDNFFNNIVNNKVPLSFLIEMFYGYGKKEILSYSGMKTFKLMCNKICNLEERNVVNKCPYYLFRNLIYNFIPENAFIKKDGNNERVNNNNMYIKNKKEIPFKCSSYIFFLDNILSKNQKKKEECIYRMNHVNISYTYVEYEIKDTFENIFFDVIKYISTIMEANRNIMNLQNYDNKEYKMFIELNNIILEKESKLKHVYFYNTLEEYIQSLDGINKIFAEDIIKEIMDIYSNKNNDNVDNGKSFFRTNKFIINRRSNDINYNNNNNNNNNNDIFMLYNDNISNENSIFPNVQFVSNINDYEKRGANKNEHDILKVTMESNMNDIKNDEEIDMLVLLNKYFFDFYINVRRMNEEYNEYFDVTYKYGEIKNVQNKNKDNQLLRKKENEEKKRKRVYTSFIKLKEKYMNEKINNGSNITNEYISGETINDTYVNMKHSNGELLNPQNSTDKIILNSMNVLKNITDKIKKDNNFSHVNKINEIDIPTVAEEERKIDDFYEYEKTTMRKIHENKENIYRMINEDLDILLKPAQDEYIKVAKNIKNKLLQEYEQILKEQISDDEI